MPNFQNGAEPYGRFAGRELFATDAYFSNNNNLGRDVGAAKVEAGLTEAVGSLPVRVNVPRGTLQFFSGYPVPKFGGGVIVYSYDNTVNDRSFTPNPIGMCL